MDGRRQFLGSLVGAAALEAFARAAPAAHPRSAAIRAVAFDLLAIFDPRSVVRVAESIVPGRGRELCESWRVRQFEYSWLRAAAGAYRDFYALTEDALAFAARSNGVTLSVDSRRTLVDAYEQLAPWADAPGAIQSMKNAGLRLATLTNFTPAMVEALLANAGMRSFFDEVISTDQTRTFKPDPRAYALGPRVLRLRREEIAFAAFGGWDAAGATWFGYPTFWVNRLGLAVEELPSGSYAVGSTLNELAAWVSAR